MLSLHTLSNGSKKSQVNILPCKIHRNGPSKVTKRFWSPTVEEDGSKTAYFRGRKLRGRQVKLPKSYHGLAVIKTDQVLPETVKQPQEAALGQFADDEDAAENDAQAEPVKILKEAANFDMITVWGHDRLPAVDDNFVKGIEEWIAFAEAIHTTQNETTQPSHAASGGVSGVETKSALTLVGNA